MNCYNNVNLMGRISSDITQTIMPSGKVKVSFSVAVNRAYKNADGERDADFIRCEVWGPTAAYIQKYFSKGDPICINGELRNNNYTDKEGIKRYSFFVNVTTAMFTVQNHSKENNQNSVKAGYQEQYYSESDIPSAPEEFDYYDGIEI